MVVGSKEKDLSRSCCISCSFRSASAAFACRWYSANAASAASILFASCCISSASASASTTACVFSSASTVSSPPPDSGPSSAGRPSSAGGTGFCLEVPLNKFAGIEPTEKWESERCKHVGNEAYP